MAKSVRSEITTSRMTPLRSVAFWFSVRINMVHLEEDSPQSHREHKEDTGNQEPFVISNSFLCVLCASVVQMSFFRLKTSQNPIIGLPLLFVSLSSVLGPFPPHPGPLPQGEREWREGLLTFVG